MFTWPRRKNSRSYCPSVGLPRYACMLIRRLPAGPREGRSEYPAYRNITPFRPSRWSSVGRLRARWECYVNGSPDPTVRTMFLLSSDACWLAPRRDALISWRTVFEPCELGRSSKLASLLFDQARRGVNGFGSFCRNKRTSAAGPKPGA
jgi:hypothetical protein